jgi:iron complex outermembrane receptor protein
MSTPGIGGSRPRLIGCGSASIVALAALGLESPANAQSAPTGATTSAVGEVVVTGRHREENVQDVPASVAVVGGELLAATNTNSIAQVTRLVPSLKFSEYSPRSTFLNIRGLGSVFGLANDGLDPGVGFYIDGVYYNRPGTVTFDLVDVDHIEVLNGPQGTLYGKNTTAGAVTVTSRAPAFATSATGEVTSGSYGFSQVKGSVTGPLVSGLLAGRLSVSVNHHDGYQRNFFDGSRINSLSDQSYRGQLLYTPTDDLRFRLIADYSKQTAKCCAQAFAGYETLPSGVNYQATAVHFGYQPVVGQININAPVKADQETGGVSVEGDWSHGKVALTSITAWRFWNFSPATDLIDTPLDDFRNTPSADQQTQFTQEFRIVSTGSNLIDYVGGLYFFHEAVKNNSSIEYGSAAAYLLLGPTVPAASVTGITQNAIADLHAASYAAFGQATWHITPRLNLTGGLRYTHDAKNGTYFSVGSRGEATFRANLAPTTSLSAAAEKGEVSGHADVSYQFTDDILGYASYSRGYRSIGLNLAVLPPGASTTVAPESIDAYEMGLKTRLFDRKLTLNVDAFYETDRNYQATVTAFVNNVGRAYIGSVPRVLSKGFEVSASARPLEALSLYASATYDDASYDLFPAAPCPVEAPAGPACSQSGQDLSGVPLWSASAGFEFYRPITLAAREVEAYLGADDSYRSSEYSQSTNSIYSRLPALNLVNLRIGLRDPGRRWDAYVFGKNVGSERYYANLTSLPYGYVVGTVGDPAIWGATLRLHY